MKRSIFLPLIILCSVTNLYSQILWEIKKDTVRKWHYYFGDEFQSAKIDENKWHIGPPYGKANKRLDTYFLNENVRIQNGEAYIFVDTQKMMKPIEPWLVDSLYFKKNNIAPVNGLYPFSYSSGMLWSKRFFKSGYFELRFKVEKGTGTWPSFWMYGTNQKDELDFFELKGERLNQIHVDVHCKKGCDGGYKSGIRKVNWGGWVNLYNYLYNGFNTMSGIWEPSGITFYLNGFMVGKFKGGFETAMSLIVSTGVSKNDFAFAPGPDKTTPFPCGIHVDYIRVFGTADTVKLGSNYSFGFVADTTNRIIPKKVKTKKYIFKAKRDDDVRGFISYYKLDHNTLLFEVKGKLNKPTIELKDDSGKKVLTKVLDYSFNKIDITGFKHGKYNLTISLGGKKLLEEQLYLLH